MLSYHYYIKNTKSLTLLLDKKRCWESSSTSWRQAILCMARSTVPGKVTMSKQVPGSSTYLLCIYIYMIDRDLQTPLTLYKQQLLQIFVSSLINDQQPFDSQLRYQSLLGIRLMVIMKRFLSVQEVKWYEKSLS
jgi:hypothetical protein